VSPAHPDKKADAIYDFGGCRSQNQALLPFLFVKHQLFFALIKSLSHGKVTLYENKYGKTKLKLILDF
jgi:hypothetical protein